MSNRGQAAAYRGEVLLHLHSRGFHSAGKPPEPKGDGRTVHGDVTGLPVTTAVRSNVTMNLSGAITEAKREAEAEGHDVFVTVQRRRGDVPVGESFVTTTLDCWLGVLARLHPEVVTS